MSRRKRPVKIPPNEYWRGYKTGYQDCQAEAAQIVLTTGLWSNPSEREALAAAIRAASPLAGKWRCILSELLDHYLACYEGNEDALAISAKQLLTAPGGRS